MNKIFTDKRLTGRIFAKVTFFLTLGATLVLSGCVGGDTYGTGVTQERQLLTDLEGMLSMGAKRNRANIDYSVRPDLVMPPKNADLPEPLKSDDAGSYENWPESPERKLARVRAEAEEADPRSGKISVSELKRKKEGIRISSKKMQSSDMERDGHWMIEVMSDDKAGKKARELKSRYAYSKDATRKYLTEPPVEYRVPDSSAPADDVGVPEREKQKRAAKAEKIKRQNDTGLWTDN